MSGRKRASISEKASFGERAKQLKQDIPAVFLALKNPKTPMVAKLVAAITVVYALSPIDLIPDFIPVLGYLDDLILLPALVSWTIKLIPNQIWEESRLQSVDLWKDGKPKRWYYALPILFFWFLIAWLIVKAIWL